MNFFSIMYNRRKTMSYSTLKEAYNVDSFEREKEKKSSKSKKKIKQEDENIEDSQNISEHFEPTPSPEITKPVVEEKKIIKPFYDEELDKYLDIRDFQNSPQYTPQNFRDNNDKINYIQKNSPLKASIEDEKDMKQLVVADKSKSTNTKEYAQKDIFYRNLVNIGLFVLIGILIIFLCDQITEIAINIGMKRTILLLEPHLQHLLI